MWPLEQVLQRWWSDPEWRAARQGARDDMSVGSYYSSPHYVQLCERTGQLAAKDTSVLIEVGVDWFECFNFKTHSVGVVMLRAGDLNLTARADVRKAVPFAIISGPKQPKSMDCVLGPLAAQLRAAAGAFDGGSGRGGGSGRTPGCSGTYSSKQPLSFQHQRQFFHHHRRCH